MSKLFNERNKVSSKALRPFDKTDWYGVTGVEPFEDGSKPLIADMKVTNWPEINDFEEPKKILDEVTVIVDKSGISISGIQGVLVRNSLGSKEVDVDFANGMLRRQPIDFSWFMKHGFEETDEFDPREVDQFKLDSAPKPITGPGSALASVKTATDMNTKIKLQARDALSGIADVSYSPQQRVLIAKHGYFYTHGMDERKFADKVVKALNNVGLRAFVVATSNHWNAWPKDSWFEARFTVESSPLVGKTPPTSIPRPSSAFSAPVEAVDPGEVGGVVTSSVADEEPEIEAEDMFTGSLTRYDMQDFIDICSSRYGWAVAEQLKDILHGESYAEQNPNALKSIERLARTKGEIDLADSIAGYLGPMGESIVGSSSDDDRTKCELCGKLHSGNEEYCKKCMPKRKKKAETESPSPASEPIKNSSAPKSTVPIAVPVIAKKKRAMSLNYEQILNSLDFEADTNAPIGREMGTVYWGPVHGDETPGLEAVVVKEDGSWEAYGGGGANDIVSEGHGPETLQDFFRSEEGQKRLNKRGAFVRKRADKEIDMVEPPEDILEDDIPVEDDLPVEDVSESGLPTEDMSGTGGLDPQSLGTKAIGAAIKALAGVPEFMDDKSAVLWIEQLSSVLKNRPVEQKSAKSHGQPVKCECGNKAMAGSDMCGACEKEYAASQEEKAASVNKNAVAPEGWEGTVKKMKKHPEIDNPWALAWHMKGEGYTPHRAAYLLEKNASLFVKKFASAAIGGAWTSNDETSEICDGGKRVPEVAEAHKMRDDNTGIKRPATVLPEKLAAEMTVTKALKACEDAEEDLKKMYLSLKPLTKVNDVAAIRNSVEAVYSAMLLFEDAKKAFNKMLMAEEAEEEATKAAKKESSKEASVKFFGLNIAEAE